MKTIPGPISDITLFLSILTSIAVAQDLDVPYVPTPMEVVQEMIRIADVDSTDTLYDLGCGDGRIVITAVKERNAAYGVGVDLDPERISESRRNAEEAGVTDRVRFIQGDLYNVNISGASVLTMYLLPNVNLQLRPKIFNELTPGARIVSHDFDMGYWRPDDQKRIGNSAVYFWVLPANVSGTWNFSLNGTSHKMQIDQLYQQLSGTVSNAGEIKNISISGDKFNLEFSNENKQKSSIRTLSGTVRGNQIIGNVSMADGSNRRWKALREKGSEDQIYQSETDTIPR